MFTRQLLIHAVKISHFTTAHTDIASRYILIGTNITPQFQHERLAEAHNFGIALSARCKVRTALCSAHGECGQSILEGLFKTQEFQNTEVY